MAWNSQEVLLSGNINAIIILLLAIISLDIDDHITSSGRW